MFHGERIGEMTDFAYGAVLEQDFNNVEAHFHLGIAQQAQIIQAGAGKSAAAFGVDGGGGPDPLLRGSGFHFHEDETIAVAEDEVDFAARRAEVGGKEFQAKTAQVFASGALAELAEAEVEWE